MPWSYVCLLLVRKTFRLCANFKHGKSCLWDRICPHHLNFIPSTKLVGRFYTFIQGFRILNSYHTPPSFFTYTKNVPNVHVQFECMFFRNSVLVCNESVPCHLSTSHFHFTRPLQNLLFKMLSSKAPLLFCQNPFCLKFNKKPFSNQAAYTQHIDRNIGCYNFIVKKSHLAATHGASVSHRRRLHEDENVTCTSNKRPALLRRHLVNDPHMDFVDKENLLQSPAGNGVGFESTYCEDIEDCNKSDDLSVLSDDPNILTCTNSAVDEDAEAPSFRSNFMYTTDQKWTVSLLKILDHVNVPDYTYGEVLEWALGTLCIC